MRKETDVKKEIEKKRKNVRVCNYVSAIACLLLAAVALINAYTDFFEGMPALLWTLIGILFAAVVISFVCDIFILVRLRRLKKSADSPENEEKKGWL